MSTDRSEAVASLERGLRVIAALDERFEMMLSEIARKNSQQPATARRIL